MHISWRRTHALPAVLLVSLTSCLPGCFWCGAGYFSVKAIIGLIGDFQRLKVLLVIVVVGIAGFYLAERFWLSPKVEEADPERLQEFEHAAQERFRV